MDEVLENNEYLIDLSKVENISEIMFKLTSFLEKDEVKNKRICLKFGNIYLNEAQLLSIKYLITGIGSSLSSIDTDSVETEKTALSLGIIISNVLPENSSEIVTETEYKTTEETNQKECPSKFCDKTEECEQNLQEMRLESDSEQREEVEVITPEPDLINVSNQSGEQIYTSIENEGISIQDVKNEETGINVKEEEKNNEEILDTSDVNKSVSEMQSDNNDTKVPDELDVIFSNPITSVFEDKISKKYTQKEELTDIIVPEIEYTKDDIEIEKFPTKYIKQTIRSGQVINYEGNIVIIGDCHPGSEILASGDITVWGILSGIAHAGIDGNKKAKVRALKMNAIQLRIANCYSRRPDSLNTIFVEKTNSFTPEEARIVNGEIVVFKIND